MIAVMNPLSRANMLLDFSTLQMRLKSLTIVRNRKNPVAANVTTPSPTMALALPAISLTASIRLPIPATVGTWFFRVVMKISVYIPPRMEPTIPRTMAKTGTSDKSVV